MSNAGIDAAQQAAIGNALSGGAQAIGAAVHAARGNAAKEGGSDFDVGDGSSQDVADDESLNRDDDDQSAAHGGEIQSAAERKRAKSFLQMLRAG